MLWLAEWLGGYLNPYEPIFKLISFVVGPAVAMVAFVWNRWDRAELKAQARALGEAEERARATQETLNASRQKIQTSQEELERKGAEVERLRNDLHSITEGSQELWKLRPAKPFTEYLTWLRDPAGARTITFGNLKGGVGKTTLAANFAAYLSSTRKMPVLLVDLDYQGSLSNMLLLAIEKERSNRASISCSTKTPVSPLSIVPSYN